MKYLSFEGRSGGAAYFVQHLVALVCLFAPGAAYGVSQYLNAAAIWVIIIGSVVATIWVALSVSVRRLHDLGLSGWWWPLTLIIPFAGLYLLFAGGQDEDNKFGPPTWAIDVSLANEGP